MALLSSALVLADEATQSNTDDWTSDRPDGHAPIGVMSDHMHHKGEWMLSYRFMYMDMDGMRNGTDNLSSQDVFAEGYMVSPKKMTMEMHMLGAMYAPSDDITLVAMVPFSRKDMDLETKMGMDFSTESSGLNDISIGGLYRLASWDQQTIHAGLSLSLPTGSTDERDDTPMGSNQVLPYPMQMGSGTYDLLPTVTYLGQTECWSWGAQLGGALRMGRNDEGYSLGNRGNATSWIAREWADWVSSSFRIDGSIWGNIDGANDDLNPMMIPTADPKNQGGKRVDLALGFNFYKPDGRLAGNRLGIEVGAPVYQDLDGPQMKTDWTVTAGWQYAW
ncbi:transporter [Puniceicoccus vermicola]|uniref:Transporter n=1 Tax=Puniceicoccus vermicola TaxID=388746 RepID=A0A7X1AVG2_9BACT|nr:transporter [Puniceicoccus vermicola]MBC2600557.1 transporter [Puniceicoccus vermicola]